MRGVRPRDGSRRLPALLLGAVVLSTARPSGAGELSDLVDRFDHLRIGDAAAVRDRTLSAGRFTCALKTGRVATVRAGDEVVGLFFEGDGTMEYLSTDPVEAAVVQFDVRKGSGL